MGLFHKNTNEYNFAGGSKNIRESLQEEFVGKDVLVHLDPREDFNTGTVVTVNLGEEAMFVKNGEVVGVMSNGRHELSTENYPFLSRIRNMITGGISTFHCRIYYVRTAHSIIEWGTPNGIQYQDNWYKCPTIARGHGEYWITFKNIPKFVANLMGNQNIYTIAELYDTFNGQISSQATRIIAEKLELLTQDHEITAFNNRKIVEDLEKVLKPDIQELLDEYGLELKRYCIKNLEIEEDERRAAAVSTASMALAESRAKVQLAQGDVAAYQAYGSAYQTIKGMELLKDIANNPGAGGIASAGAGLGMGMAAGNVFGNIAQSVFSNAVPTPQTLQQPQSYGAGNRFGNNNTQSQVNDPMEELGKLKQMLDAGFITNEQFELKRMLIIGMITQEQYDAKINEIMNRM